MKRGRTIFLLILVLLLVLREMGVFRLYVASVTSETSGSRFHNDNWSLNVTEVKFLEDDGTPLIPQYKEPDDTYRCTVQYKINANYSPWRWLPILKFGENSAQITYIVWIGQHAKACGAANTTGTQRIFGLSSARDYEEKFTASLMESMKEDVTPKLKIFHR